MRYYILMSSFSDRVREEIEFMGISQKELAFKAEVKKRALDMYLGNRESMPPADVAVRLAKALNVTVEYLVTGEDKRISMSQNEMAVVKDLERIPANARDVLETVIHLYAKHGQNT